MSKVAIVHDYFVQTGGAERVAEALYSIYPDATVFATVALPDRMPSSSKRPRFALPGCSAYRA